MKYNQMIGELDRQLDRIYNIAFSQLRRSEYKMKEENIKKLLEGNSGLTATVSVEMHHEANMLKNEMEDLFKLRESIQNKLRLLFDHDEDGD